MSKTAFITGVTGQDGSFLADLLLEKDYKVIGLISGKYNIGYDNVEHIKDKLIFEEGDLLDQDSLKAIFVKHHPDEVYNLAGLTFIPPSWEKPTLTLNINTLGVTRILELISKDFPQTKFYQASSSKIFGNSQESPQTLTTPIMPQDPYSVSKAASHYMVKVMRDHFNLFAVSGILFNHESERRGPEFVTRKITQTAVKIKLDIEKELKLGDLDVQQDWGYAPDYVEAMWLMLQQDEPRDYVVATGKLHSVRDICDIAFKHLGLNYEDYVTIDKTFTRKETYQTPVGDSQETQRLLNWQPKISFEEMIVKMVDTDRQLLEKPAQ